MEVVEALGRCLQTKAGLAGAPGAGQREQPDLVTAEQFCDNGELTLATDQRGGRDRQVGRPVFECAPRRERVRGFEGDRLVLAQDGRFEIAQLPAGLQPQLVAQEAASGVVHLQRFGLPAGPVQGEHQPSG